MKLKIAPLSKYPQHNSIVAYWAYESWHKDRKTNYDIIKKDYERRGDFNKLPVTWIALIDEVPVGMVSLKEIDLIKVKSLTPWLSALYVAPAYRNKGIGAILINHLVQNAAAMEYNEVYLFVDYTNSSYLKKYYEKQDWSYYDKAQDCHGNNVEIYSYRI